VLRLPSAGASDTNAIALDLRAVAADPSWFDERWTVTLAELPDDGLYHTLNFDFMNPRQQTLAFVVNYTGNAGLRADTLTVTPVR
jgi:hypothetical protein